MLALAGAAPDRARLGLVLVHGRGGSAEDILGLGRALALPDIALIAPQAPGNSWWPTSFLAPTEQIEPHVSAGLAAVEQAVDALEQSLPRDRIALAGFSQGGCLALEYAARRGGVSAVFGLSAGLVGVADADGPAAEVLYGFGPKSLDYAAELPSTPVLIAVHERDPHIPLARAQSSADAFRRIGADVTLQVASGEGHGITPDNLAAMRAILSR
jgi:predicted esterase